MGTPFSRTVDLRHGARHVEPHTPRCDLRCRDGDAECCKAYRPPDDGVVIRLADAAEFAGIRSPEVAQRVLELYYLRSVKHCEFV